jgi:hypothetical protein
LAEHDLSKLDILAVWIDGLQLGSDHVICAVGVDAKGHKHVLGLREGATENAVVASALLEDLVARGLDPKRRRLFVIDGSKALRKAIDQVFGTRTPVQRCRNHKLRNVLGHLPEAQHDQTKATLKAAFKLEMKEGKARRSSISTRRGSSGDGAARRARCVRAWTRCSRSTAWACPASFVAALARRTSSTTATRRFATEFAA